QVAQEKAKANVDNTGTGNDDRRAISNIGVDQPGGVTGSALSDEVGAPNVVEGSVTPNGANVEATFQVGNGNNSMVMQVGTNQEAVATQLGDNNTSVISQTDDANEAATAQVGADNNVIVI